RSALYSAPWSISLIRFPLCVQMQIKRLNHREHGEHGESKKFMKTGELSNALDAVPIETSLPMDSLCFLRVLRVLRGSVFSSVSTVRQQPCSSDCSDASSSRRSRPGRRAAS